MYTVPLDYKKVIKSADNNTSVNKEGLRHLGYISKPTKALNKEGSSNLSNKHTLGQDNTLLYRVIGLTPHTIKTKRGTQKRLAPEKILAVLKGKSVLEKKEVLKEYKEVVLAVLLCDLGVLNSKSSSKNKMTLISLIIDYSNSLDRL